MVGEEKKEEEEEIKDEDIEEISENTKLKTNNDAPRNSKGESKRKTVKF
jgi:hypothetical protein